MSRQVNLEVSEAGQRHGGIKEAAEVGERPRHVQVPLRVTHQSEGGGSDQVSPTLPSPSFRHLD